MTNSLFSRLSQLAVAGVFFASAVVGLPASAAAPTVGSVSPVSITANQSTTLSSSVYAASGIQYCRLYVESEDVGAMNVSGGMASLPYTFTTFGVHTVFVFCKDNNNQGASGPNTSIFVQGGTVQNAAPLSGGFSEPSPEPTPILAPAPTPSPTPTHAPEPTPIVPAGPQAGSLIKLTCAEGAEVDDSCTAVYYVGKDGKRHAFSSGKVFFTWYADFNSVLLVTPEVMGSLALGKNVTYRPGSRLVKFPTLNNVYAVEQGGLLRWIKTEAAATSLYGTDWSTKVDDIPDAFYSNYTFGQDISDASSYSVSSGMAAGVTIDESF